MSYLVDGNNVMGQRVGWHRDKPAARRRLLIELSKFSRSANVTIEVVFDGAPEDFFPDGSKFMGVRVFYAHRGSNADERIKKIVEDSRERRTLKVVTSDRALASYVRSCGASVVSSGDFRRRLDTLMAGVGKEKDDSSHGPQTPGEDLDEWMHYFGVSADDDE